jgi:hypothetical protein
VCDVLDGHGLILLMSNVIIVEFFADRICSPCPDGTYSFTDPSTVLSLTTGVNCRVVMKYYQVLTYIMDIVGYF